VTDFTIHILRFVVTRTQVLQPYSKTKLELESVM